MPERNARGTFTPVVYFENASGHLILPSSANDEKHRGWNGYVRRETGTLAGVDELQKRLEGQERREMQMRLEHDERIFAARRQKVRDTLLATMTRSTTKPFERDFIRDYLGIADERKRKFYQKHNNINAYFMAREYDDGGNRLIQE